MKRLARLTILTALIIAVGSVAVAHAEILPPRGMGQIGLQAYVLCEKLTVRKAPDASSATVTTLNYGSLPIVMDQRPGWAYCAMGDSEDSLQGWVNSDYIAIDPAWYRTDGRTVVYAWNDMEAPRVALLNAGVTLPILRDDGRWLVVSLRGATGWIRR